MFHRMTGIAVLILSIGAAGLAQEPPALPEGFVLRGDLLVPEVTTEGVYAGIPWSQGIVDYYVDPAVGPTERRQLARAIAEIEAVCDVYFRQLPTHGGQYLYVFDGTANFATLGAWSSCSGVCQSQMSIRDWDQKWVIVHELMHVLGFDHEHNHPLRDQFIQVNTENVMAGELGNFAINPNGMNYSNPYDFDSVLHYGPLAFSGNMQPTIEVLPAHGEQDIGQRTHMSQGDADDLRTVYGAPPAPVIHHVRSVRALGASGNVEVRLEGGWFFQGSDDSRGVQGSRVTYDGVPVRAEVEDANFLTAIVEEPLLRPGGQLRVHNDFPGGGDSNAVALTVPAGLRSVRITEVAWGGPTGVEIMNLSRDEAVDLSGWTLRIRGGYNTGRWFPAGTVIGPREIILMLDVSQGLPPEAPVGARIIDCGGLGAFDDGISVSLVTPGFDQVDEVRIETGLAAGTAPPTGYGRFTGYAKRSVTGTPVSVERIWDLDSDTGRDWTGEATTSLGLENRNAGIRGRDPREAYRTRARITEIDPLGRYVEIWNTGSPADFRGCYLLCSAVQNERHRVLRLESTGVIGNTGYFVVGNAATPPAEMPGEVPYVDLGALGGPLLSLGEDEFSLGLYSHEGVCMDLVRTTGHDDLVVHNAPRAPAHWRDFVGAAVRTGTGTLGREGFVGDTDTGADWGMVSARSLGTLNPGWSGAPGHGLALDVRIAGGEDPFGLTLVINAGPAHAGKAYGMLSAYGARAYGQGSFFGLDPSAATNWALQHGISPWGGVLDADGSFRFDLPPGALPGFVADHRVVVYDAATGQIELFTLVLEEDHAAGLPF